MQDLTKGSITKHMFQFAAFMSVSMFVQTLYFLADLYWVGRLGKESIAAVGLAGTLTFVTLALTQTLGVGTTTLVSHAAGRKDKEWRPLKTRTLLSGYDLMPSSLLKT